MGFPLEKVAATFSFAQGGCQAGPLRQSCIASPKLGARRVAFAKST